MNPGIKRTKYGQVKMVIVRRNIELSALGCLAGMFYKKKVQTSHSLLSYIAPIDRCAWNSSII